MPSGSGKVYRRKLPITEKGDVTMTKVTYCKERKEWWVLQNKPIYSRGKKINYWVIIYITKNKEKAEEISKNLKTEQRSIDIFYLKGIKYELWNLTK